MQKKTLIQIFFISALLLNGCKSSKDLQKEDVLWPSPPDEPRIKYVKTYTGEDDFQSQLGKIAQNLTGKKGVMKLAKPFDVCSDGKGRIFVSDVAQGILVFDESQKKVFAFGEKMPIDLINPLGISYGNGKVFVGVAKQGQVVVLTPDGQYVRTIGRQGAFPNPVGVEYDNVKKRVLIVDNKLHNVFVYSEDGDSLMALGKRGEGDGEFNFPQSVTVDSSGNIYVVDAFNFRIEIFDSNGKFIKKFGKQGNVYGAFARPKGIAIDSYQNIYIVDAVHQNFQIFNQNLELLLFVGRFSNSDNWGFQNPIGICIDQNNTIYVADQLNERIQVFQLLTGN